MGGAEIHTRTQEREGREEGTRRDGGGVEITDDPTKTFRLDAVGMQRPRGFSIWE